jgi:hypothetical protein
LMASEQQLNLQWALSLNTIIILWKKHSNGDQKYGVKKKNQFTLCQWHVIWWNSFRSTIKKKKKNPWTKSMVALDWTRNYFCFLCRKLTPRTRERWLQAGEYPKADISTQWLIQTARKLSKGT